MCRQNTHWQNTYKTRICGAVVISNVQDIMHNEKHKLLSILIVIPGCEHGFGNKLLKVKWQHIQVAQHSDTNAMFL